MATRATSTTISTGFGFKNVTDSTKAITLKKLGLKSNYGVTEDEATKCVLSNTGSPIDEPEIISLSCSRIDQVNSVIPNYYPPKVGKGVTYQAKIEELLSVTDSSDPLFRVDLPIVAQLSIRHTTSGEITDDVIEQIFVRLISAFYRDDGTSRFKELMRSALEPSND